MKSSLLLTLFVAIALLVSCSRKEEPGRVTFEMPARDSSAIIDEYASTLTKGAVMTNDDASTRDEESFAGTLTDPQQAAQEAADEANARNEQMIRTLEEIDK